jgi:hypothetical protein
MLHHQPLEQLKLDETMEHEIMVKLTDYQVGYQILLKRIKESIASATTVALFLNKRALFEQEYSKNMARAIGPMNGKQGKFAACWSKFMDIHNKSAQKTLSFSAALLEMSENITTLARNTERSRKQLKESANQSYRQVQEAEAALEKAKLKFEKYTSELAQPSEPQLFGISMKGLKFAEDPSQKVSSANAAYKSQLQYTNQTRDQYFKKYLPSIIQSLTETIDDCDICLQKYLTKYAALVESSMVENATLISPIDGSKGLVHIFSDYNIKADFMDYMNAILENRTPTNKAPLPSIDLTAANDVREKTIVRSQTFGIQLPVLMKDSTSAVPYVVTNMISYLDKHLAEEGLYRISGSSADINQVRDVLEKNPKANLDFIKDPNAVAGALKTFFRELPDSLFPHSLYNQLIDAAKLSDSKKSLILVHEMINGLHDANYATLRDLMAHLLR